jgi:hypothetical protein
MPSTYSNLKIQLMATGENATTWGNVTNINLGTAIEEAIAGSADVTFASNNQTLTLTDTNGSQAARNMRLRCTGTTGGSTRDLTVPSIEKPYIVRNDCADSVVVKTAAGTGVTVPAGASMWVYSDGTNVVSATTHLASLTLASPLAIASGGTGGNTASAARTALGAAASGTNTDITTLNPSGGLQVGTPSGGARGAGTVNATGLFVNGVAVGTGSGSVTSVALSGGTTGLTVSGSPITTSGTITLAGTLAIANGGTGATSAANARTALAVPSTTGSGASGTWGINVTGSAATATNATNAANLVTSNFSIVESGGVLFIKHGSTNIAKIDSSGAFTALNNVTAFGSV